MNKLSLLLSVLLLCSLRVAAATTPPLSACDPLNGCLIGSQLFSNGNVEIYSGLDTNTFEEFVWAKYTLGSASNYYNPYDDSTYFPPLPPPLTVPLTGEVWIKAKTRYYAGDDRIVSFYGNGLDMWGNEVELDFSMTDEAMTSGYGYSYSAGGFGEVSGPITAYENMSPLNLFTCVECGWDMELNLINMLFIGDGAGNLFFAVNPNDSRELIFRHMTTYYYGDEYTYTLASVPVPSAAWLFMSGLLLLGSRRQSKVRM